MKTNLQLSDLNSGQQDTISEGVKWYESEEQCFVIDGEPGTGKTSVVKFLIESLPDAIPLFNAPTHEATGQLADKLGEGAACETSHRALGLKVNKFYDDLRFEKGDTPKAFENCNLFVMDEASMAGLGGKEEKQLLDHALDSYDKIIFLGDWAQLPPIGAKNGDSPVFTQGFQTQTLTQVERHAGDILTYVQKVRAEILKPIRKVPAVFGEIEELKAKPGVIPGFTKEMKQEISEGKGRILTWTNGKTSNSIVPGVREYNQLIREFKFGVDMAKAHPFLESEIIVLSSPSYLFQGEAEKHESLKDLTFKGNLLKRQAVTNARGLVTRVGSVTLLGVQCHKLDLELVKGGKTVIYVPTLKGKAKYENTLKEMQLRAASAGAGAKEIYRLKHTFSELFTFATPSYSQTCQKAQGSTIESVYVDVRNILQVRPTEWKMAFKLLNVACSRSSRKLTLIRGV
jgi:hypothetical protein